jgi:acetoin utilization deacetylase AcuC-like enzyme
MARSSAIIDLSCAAHDNPHHPESQSRLVEAISGIPDAVPRFSPEPATLEDIHRIHDPHYTQWLKERCSDAVTLAHLDGETYVTPASFDAALGAAGGAIAALERSLAGEHAFAFVRPPGHHAERAKAMGFCLLNNVAIAVQKALGSVDRVAIVDWDVHHGNGTQNAFYLSNRVLFCSIHQDHLFPFSGGIGDIGNGTGKGFTINAPLMAGATIADYHAVFSDVFVPAIERFRPSALIVSAGQDILSDDPLGGMNIQPDDLCTLTALLMRSVDFPLSLVLEGGYGPSHGAAISAVFEALGGDHEPVVPEMPPRPHTRDIVTVLKKMHRLP